MKQIFATLYKYSVRHVKAKADTGCSYPWGWSHNARLGWLCGRCDDGNELPAGLRVAQSQIRTRDLPKHYSSSLTCYSQAWVNLSIATPLICWYIL
jgi:hypothetical protein